MAALIRGDGGSGKSVLLRRLAHDLSGEYTVYWLESDIRSFLDCEWTYDILRQEKTESPPEYLIFVEDWYQHIENSGLKKEAAELLAKASKTSYVRLVIGDRIPKPGAKKGYENQVLNTRSFELEASENVALVDTILTRMPEWKGKFSKEQMEKAANATLFQLLFIFQYADDQHGTIADIYRRIFASDCRALLERPSDFWRGIAKALVFSANLYVREGIVVSVEFLRDLAGHFGHCAIPNRYHSSIEELVNDGILKKYLGLNPITKKNVGLVNRFRFHHDTMADSGWIQLAGLVGEQYDEITLQGVIRALQDRYYWIFGRIHFRQVQMPGEKGEEAARNYLNTRNPQGEQNAFTISLHRLCNENLAKSKAREFLNTENPWVIAEAFNVCLGLVKTEDLAKIRAREFLNTENPWIIPSVFNVCLDVVKKEDLAKIKAREFLNTENPWVIFDVFVVCLNLLKDEEAGIDNAVYILENRNEFTADHHWTLLFRSLNVLHDKLEHRRLVTLAASEIIANRKRMPYRYGQLLQIPLFFMPQWVQSTEYSISNWDQRNKKNLERPWIHRNAVYSVTISYGDKPELIEAMCLGLIRNWRFELRIKQKHQAYFIRCLAHPAIRRDSKLQQEMIAISEEILCCEMQPPLIIHEGTRIWLQNIVERNQFPEWSYEQ